MLLVNSKVKPKKGDIVVASNSGTTMLYVIGHDKKVVSGVGKFLQNWRYSGVIFSREKMAGTFPLKEVRLDSKEAPDFVISLRWTDAKNRFGVAGMISTDGTAYKPGQGAHVTLSPFDLHNTLIAAGPDFRAGYQDKFPSGNLDVTPTVLHVLGIKPLKPLDGRVLTEALSETPEV